MTSYERVKVVRQDEQRQTHPVGHESVARQPSPVQRVLPLLDPPLGCPSTIVERTTPSGPAVMFVTMKPTRGNNSPLCHATLATTHRARCQLPARYQNSSYRITGRSAGLPTGDHPPVCRAHHCSAHPLSVHSAQPFHVAVLDKHLGLEPAHGVGADGRSFRTTSPSNDHPDRRPSVQRRWYLGSPPDDCTPTA